MKSENKIVELSFDFAITIIDLYRQLGEKKEFILSRQLLRSGTSIGANVEETIAAQSRKDFIFKMSIASIEARETRYWLRLLNKSKLIKLDYQPYLESIEHIINIITKIVKTTVESSVATIQNSKLKI